MASWILVTLLSSFLLFGTAYGCTAKTVQKLEECIQDLNDDTSNKDLDNEISFVARNSAECINHFVSQCPEAASYLKIPGKSAFVNEQQKNSFDFSPSDITCLSDSTQFLKEIAPDCMINHMKPFMSDLFNKKYSEADGICLYISHVTDCVTSQITERCSRNAAEFFASLVKQSVMDKVRLDLNTPICAKVFSTKKEYAPTLSGVYQLDMDSVLSVINDFLKMKMP